jgi:hypothetical protein
VILFYDSSAYASRYDIIMISVGYSQWVKTYNNTTKVATNLWCANYNKTTNEDIHLKANITTGTLYDPSYISQVLLTLKTASNNTITGYEDVAMTLEASGSDWALYNYTIPISDLSAGLYKVVIKTIDTFGNDDKLRGECNSRVAWFRVIT